DFASVETDCGVGECAATGATSCGDIGDGVIGVIDSCAPGEPSAELCDGLDNDCDELTDAADPDLVLDPCEKQLGACSGAVHARELCVEGTWLECTPQI